MPKQEPSIGRAPTAVRCNALLFDPDGVLIDSTPAVERVWAQWATAGADFVVNSCADVSVAETAGDLALQLKSINV